MIADVFDDMDKWAKKKSSETGKADENRQGKPLTPQEMQKLEHAFAVFSIIGKENKHYPIEKNKLDNLRSLHQWKYKKLKKELLKDRLEADIYKRQSGAFKQARKSRREANRLLKQSHKLAALEARRPIGKLKKKAKLISKRKESYEQSVIKEIESVKEIYELTPGQLDLANKIIDIIQIQQKELKDYVENFLKKQERQVEVAIAQAYYMYTIEAEEKNQQVIKAAQEQKAA